MAMMPNAGSNPGWRVIGTNSGGSMPSAKETSRNIGSRTDAGVRKNATIRSGAPVSLDGTQRPVGGNCPFNVNKADSNQYRGQFNAGDAFANARKSVFQVKPSN